MTAAQRRDAAAAQQAAAANQASNDFNGIANSPLNGQGGYNSPNGQSMGTGGGMMPGGLGGNFSPQSLMPGLFAGAPGNSAGAANLLGNTAQSFQNAQNAANAANTQRANNITQGYGNLSRQSANALGGLSGLFGQQQNQFAGNTGNVLTGFNNLGYTQGAGYGNLVNQTAAGQAGINQGYSNVENAVMNNLSQYGTQQAQQIQQMYQNQQANADQNLTNRGLGNTTIMNSTNAGIQQNQNLATLANEGNTQQMVNNALMNTAYPALQSQQQGLNNVVGMGQQGLQANTALGTTALGQQYQGGQDLANLQGQALQFGQNANATQNQIGEQQLQFLNSINQGGPDYNTLMQLMMAVGAAGTGYGQNGFSNLPQSLGQVTPSPQYGAIQGPGTSPYGNVPIPPQQIGQPQAYAAV